MSQFANDSMQALSSQLEHDRVTLTRKLIALQEKYDAIAQHESMHFARHPDDEKARASATRSLLRADTQRSAISEVIELVNAHWPTIHKLAPMMAKESHILKVLP